MTKKTFLITLTPLDPYFFGSENTHGDGGANYFARSNRWPQQSTLCGVMRHLLYEHYGDPGRGTHSFTPEAIDPLLDNYGYLLGLSPLFLQRGDGSFFLRQSFNRFADSEPWPLVQSQENDETFFLTGQESVDNWRSLPIWTKPEGKKAAIDAWVNQTGEEVPSEQIFRQLTRPGITKGSNTKGNNREKAFYKQSSYRLAEGWSFAVLAEFDEAVVLDTLRGTCLPMGGEKTVFIIGVEEESRTFKEIFQPEKFFYQSSSLPEKHTLLVLTSDAFLELTDLAQVVSGVTEIVDFRCLNTRTGANAPEHFGPLHRLLPGESGFGKNYLAKSSKYNLLERGSVLICADHDLPKLKVALGRAPWHGIGFNHYFTYTA